MRGGMRYGNMTKCGYPGNIGTLGHDWANIRKKEWANIGIFILAHRCFDRWPSNGPCLQKVILISCWPNAGPTFQCFNIIPKLEIKHRGIIVIHMSPQHMIFNVGPLQQSLILNNTVFICIIECENMPKTWLSNIISLEKAISVFSIHLNLNPKWVRNHTNYISLSFRTYLTSLLKHEVSSCYFWQILRGFMQ